MDTKNENDFWNYKSISEDELFKIEQKYHKYFSDTQNNFDDEILILIKEIRQMQEILTYSKSLIISWQLIATDYRNKLFEIEKRNKCN